MNFSSFSEGFPYNSASIARNIAKIEDEKTIIQIIGCRALS